MAERNPGCFLINRAATDGTYGIWGHDLGDLVLHTIYYAPTSGEICLGIDS